MRNTYQSALDNEAFYSWGRIGKGELILFAKPKYYYHSPREHQNITTDELCSIAAGYDFGLFSTTSKVVFAWGNNDFGCLGQTLEDSYYLDYFQTPREIESLSDKSISRVFASKNLGAALSDKGVAYTWGFPGSYFAGMGALGRRCGKDFHFPKRIVRTDKDEDFHFQDLSLGMQHMMGVDLDGKLWSWGKLGNGVKDSLLPLPMPHFDSIPIKQVACNGRFENSLILTTNGKVYTGDGHPIPHVHDVCHVSVGQADQHAVLVNTNGHVFQRTRKTNGEFVPLVGIENAIQTSCGHNFAACLTQSGEVYMWGDFQAQKNGALARGREEMERKIFFDDSVPKLVKSGDFSNAKIKQVSCGSAFVLALGMKMM